MPRKKSHPAEGRAALAELHSLGHVSAGWLVAAGIETPAQLRRLGAVRAFQKVAVHRAGMGVTLNLLYALECAIRGCHWRDLAPEEKRALKRAVTE